MAEFTDKSQIRRYQSMQSQDAKVRDWVREVIGESNVGSM